ncbi:MAG: hotdog fold thioesterase [Saprospiraceae bacterium]|nr:hotdog fold thioesterase [Saprospiraceae bacterium]HMW37760.1 hotdog fold thioesterase [Saprospiraceae bacterium]HMX89636.1 hotdog fold thioesterase [Saprospiraceae bacterium]HMZ39675.1 hotdog fold thioesterase [Saprospiraceae bacterium]HNA63541.1 hotdog fold thioesterase [Saprospiraceae bacterium]
MQNIPEAVFQKMYREDGFSQWLGIENLVTETGYCKLKMQVRPEMLNGFGVAHGGIVYSLADSAFAFCCNSYNRISLSIETSITHTKAIHKNDVLYAEAKLITQSNKIGTYEVIVQNQDGEIVGVFKGICYRTEKNLITS